MNYLEKELLKRDFDEFEPREKNDLITFIAKKEGKMLYEVNPEYILSYHKKLKSRGFSEHCEEEIIKGYLHSNGNVYRTNRDDQINMLGKKVELDADDSIVTVMWKTENKGYVEHTRKEWLEVFWEAYRHKEHFLSKYEMVRAEVMAAKTHKELLEIEWEIENDSGENV